MKNKIYTVKPVSLAEYRSNLKKVIFTTLAVMLPLYLMSFNFVDYHKIDYKTLLQLVTLISTVILAKFLMPLIDIRHRLMALYPNSKEVTSICNRMFEFAPYTFVPVHVFLYFKNDNVKNTKAPFIFRRPITMCFVHFAMLISILFILSNYSAVYNSKQARPLALILDPVISYIGLTSVEVGRAFEATNKIENNFKKNHISKGLVSNYYVNHTESLIISLAHLTSYHKKLNDRLPASTSKGESAVVLGSDIYHLLEKWQHSPYVSNRMNPLWLLSPTMALSSTIMAIVDQYKEIHFLNIANNRVDKALQFAKEKYPELKSEFEKIEIRFRATSLYKFHLLANNSYFSNLVGLAER